MCGRRIYASLVSLTLRAIVPSSRIVKADVSYKPDVPVVVAIVAAPLPLAKAFRV